MSLLAELLSKVKRSEGGKRDVPPDLMEIVNRGKRRGRALKYLLALGSLSFVLLISGYYASHYYMHKAEGGEPMETEPPPLVPVALEAPHPAVPPVEGRKEEPAEVTETVKQPRVEAEPSRPEAPKPERPKSEGKVRTALERPPDSVAQSGAVNEGADADEVDAYVYTGRHYEEEMNYSMAAREYLNALRFRPADPFLLNAVAYCYLRLRMPETALQYALRAVDESPRYVPAIVNAGICYAEVGNGQEAERYLKRAIGLDRLNREAMFNLGVLYEKWGRLEESLEMYKSLVSAGHYDFSIHVARVLERTGKTDDARGVYSGILKSGLAAEEVRAEASRRLAVLTQEVPGSR